MDHDKYIGRLLDNRYEIQEVIGIGGMAVVYKARCHRLNRLVAIKILKDDYSRDEDFRRRFHAESQAVAMLSHPNIVSVYDVSSGEADYIVMELIDGISLKQYMEMKGILNWKETLHFGMQIAKALEHAHSRGIVHRDIKPHNVMVLKNGSVKVTDFGIARIMSKGNTLTKEALGSVHYISPEQAKGGRVDNRSDIYSLGVVMYEMMTGRPPYDGESPVSVAIQHINGGAAAPTTLNPNIPTGMEQIIMKGMGHEIADRYESATAMLYDMEHFRQDPAFVFPYAVGIQTGAGTIPATQMSGSAKAAQSGSAQRDRTSGQSGQQRNPVTGNSRGSQTGTRAGAAAAAAGYGTAGRSQSGQAQSGRTGQGQSGQSTMSSVAAAQARRAAAARRRAEEQEERSNRFAIIAVIVCAVTLALAILILVGIGLSRGKNNQDQAVEPATVPDYVGQYWETIRDYPPDGVTFSEDIKLDNHDSYKKGQIMSQTPAAGTQIQPGSTVTVVFTVSMGKKPLESTMLDFSNMQMEAAREYLESENMNFKFLPKEEFSDDVSPGLVTRTEPAAGEPLTEGATITLWYSKGPEYVKKAVPNVIGMEQADADDMLVRRGFENVTYLYVDSDKPKDTVVSMSVKAEEVIDVNTKITIEVSKGPVAPPPTTPPVTTPPVTTPEPTTPPPETTPPVTTQEQTISFMLPSDRTGDVAVTVICEETEVQVYAATVGVEDNDQIQIPVSGTGTQTYILYVAGVEEGRQTVTFS